MNNQKDKYTPDGFLCSGVRLIRKGGKFLFSGDKFQSDILISFEGQQLFIEIECPYGLDVSVYLQPERYNKITTIFHK